MIYSHSSINTFKTCPLKFKYNYIEKPDIEKKQSIEAFMGSMVHDTLEKLYTDIKYKKIDSIDELLSYYQKIWKENYSEDKIEIIRKGYTEDNYYKLGKEMLENYYEKNYPFNEGKILGLEKKINLEFFDQNKNITYYLVGYIDRLMLKNENKIEIVDYKTNNTTKTQQEVDLDKQLALYSIAIKNLYPFVKEIELVWHFLASGAVMRSKRSQENLEKIKHETIQAIREIEDAKKNNDFFGKPSALCDWCEFRSICPFKAHHENLKQKNEFFNDSGKDLVDKYEKYKKEKQELTKEVDKKIDDLKEAIIKYSTENNYEKLFGTKKSLLVKSFESIKLPSSKDPKREELKDFLKEIGFWDQLSDISVYKLSDKLKQGFFSNHFKQKLKDYVDFEKIYRLYLNRK